MMKTKLLLVDDHPVLRHGLREIVAMQPHLALAGEASTGELAVKLALELTPDVVVMDIKLPAMNGLETTRQILSALPATKIVIFSGNATRTLVDEAVRAGARGYPRVAAAMPSPTSSVGAVLPQSRPSQMINRPGSRLRMASQTLLTTRR